MNIPPGYLKVNTRMSAADYERLRASWQRYISTPDDKRPALVLDHGVEYVPFNQAIVPDAVCTYCTVANLSSSIWCVACGAPLTHTRGER